MTTLETVIYFTHPLKCEFDAIGKTFPLTINGYSGYMSFPRFKVENINFSNHEEYMGKLLPPRTLVAESKSLNKLNWGQCYRNNGNSFVESVALFFHIEDGNIEHIAFNINNSIDPYIESFILFAEIIVKNSIDEYSTKSVSVNPSRTFLYTINSSEIFEYDSCEICVTVHDVEHNDFLSYKSIEKALALTSDNKKPHLAHSILRDAYYHKNKGDYRRAILDATTSIEIAITNMIYNILEKKHNHTSESVKFIIKNYNGLKKKSDFLYTIHPEFKKIATHKEIEVLCKRRNESIHEGITASPADAIKIIEISQKIVHQLCSLTE